MKNRRFFDHINFLVFYRSVRGKTILYFSTVLSLSIILIGGICYAVFSQKYRSSLESQNNIRLSAVSSQIDQQVFQYAKHQFIGLLQNEILYRSINAFFRNPGYERNIKIFNSVQELRSLVAFSKGIIDSVDLYYLENQISISSYTGFMDFSLEPVRADRQLWEDTILNRRDYNWWDIRQINSYGGTKLAYFGAIPANSVQEARGFIAFSINPSIFGYFLSVFETLDTKFYLFYEDLTPIYGSMEDLEKCLSGEEIERIVRTGIGGMAYGAVSSSSEQVVSYVRSTEIPAVLVSVVSITAFREGLREIFSLVFLIGLLVFMAGLAATGFVSQRLYSPLKRMVSSVSLLSKTGNREQYRDEYSYINQAIGELYRKKNEYEGVLNEYIEVIVGDFEKALRSLNLAKILEILGHFQSLCGGLEYDGEQCRRYCSWMTEVFFHYLVEYKAENIVEYPKAEFSESMTDYGERLVKSIERTFEYIADQKRRQRVLVARLLTYINENISKPISQDSAADYCGISVGYVSKLIKEETGETWVAYLNNLRLNLAMSFLKDPSLKVEKVAAQAGFNSAAYFIKRFRSRYGLTPKAYRQEFFNHS
ncbi:MAG: AraC family transcriptional regulator [Treponema sp.]|nr:AraC family transcriptional regulator [Treponema sp.]